METLEEEKTVTCQRCECEIKEEDTKFLQDNFYCQDCFDLFEKCEDCGELLEEEDQHENPVNNGSGIYCESCYNNKFGLCPLCDSFDYIGNLIHIDFMEEYICQSCFEQDFDACASCGETFYLRDLYERDGEYYCEECLPSSNIENHDYKPSPTFYGETNSPNQLFFGIELEVENSEEKMQNREMASQIIEDNFFYCKEDSSLRNGFEIVTHPFSWEWYNKNLKVFNDLLKELQKKGFTSFKEGTCGIHIHLSKEAFSTLHLYKFMKFFYENLGFIETISQRTRSSSEGNCQWGSTKETEETSSKKAVILKAKHKDQSNRYSAINLMPFPTVEVRIFRGTLHVPSFHKNIEFLQACFIWTQQISLQQVCITSFLEFLRKNNKTYKNLFDYLKKRNRV